MNALEQQIKDTLMADKKFALEKLEQLKNPENYGVTIYERPGYYYDWLEQIDDQFERLKNGQYNVCRSCSGPIGEERLRCIPCANLCITCQKKINAQKLSNVQRLIQVFGGACGSL